MFFHRLFYNNFHTMLEKYKCVLPRTYIDCTLDSLWLDLFVDYALATRLLRYSDCLPFKKAIL